MKASENFSKHSPDESYWLKIPFSSNIGTVGDIPGKHRLSKARIDNRACVVEQFSFEQKTGHLLSLADNPDTNSRMPVAVNI